MDAIARTIHGNILDANISVRGDCLTYDKAIDRLSEYEDLGLTPEQIKETDKLYLEKCEEVNDLKKEIEYWKGQSLEAQMEKYNENNKC